MAANQCTGQTQLVSAPSVGTKRRRPCEPVVASKYFGSGPSKHFNATAPRKGSLPALLGNEPHTLIMGTQASDNALDGDIPFFTNENAFWHIIGDALGFRRGFHMRRTEAVESIRLHLLHPVESECGYDEARRRLLAAGFAVWDVVAESERAGSLDQDIRNPRFHDVRTLCTQQPSIVRICFATGQGSAKIFRGAWKRWLATPGAFTAAPDAASQSVFARYVRPAAGDADTVGNAAGRPPIELLVMESVSPAAVPAVATKSRVKRMEAYRTAGRFDLVTAGAPRAGAYAWKRACWLSSSAFPEAVLHAAARDARVFGSRPSDLLRDDGDDSDGGDDGGDGDDHHETPADDDDVADDDETALPMAAAGPSSIE
jgi:G:T/U-mismatch repair DNA glycosylase